MNDILRCNNCKLIIGNPILDGVIQIGQGMNMPFLSFCDKKCLERYEKKYHFCKGDKDFEPICKECSQIKSNTHKDGKK